MKLSKKAKIAILKGKVAKLKFQLKQAREELALQDDQLGRFKSMNLDSTMVDSVPELFGVSNIAKSFSSSLNQDLEKPKGIISYNMPDLKLYCKGTQGDINYPIFSQEKSDAATFDSLEDFYSQHPLATPCSEYKFEPIESEGVENVNVQINEQTR